MIGLIAAYATFIFCSAANPVCADADKATKTSNVIRWSMIISPF
jgi:hypothetical protein